MGSAGADPIFAALAGHRAAFDGMEALFAAHPGVDTDDIPDFDDTDAAEMDAMRSWLRRAGESGRRRNARAGRRRVSGRDRRGRREQPDRIDRRLLPRAGSAVMTANPLRLLVLPDLEGTPEL